MQRIRSTRIETAVRAVLATLFLAAGLLKVIDPLGFALAIARMQLLRRGAIGPAGITLPWMELGAGVRRSPCSRPFSWRSRGRS